MADVRTRVTKSATLMKTKTETKQQQKLVVRGVKS